MATFILWTGIILTVIGWLALAWQASKRLAVKEELEKFQQKKKTLLLHRNYCRLIILIGILLLLIALII